MCFGEGDLLVGIGYFVIGNNFTVAVNLEVAFVGVYDYVEVLIRTENLCNNAAEAFFEYAHHCGAVNVLGLFEFRECVNKADHI